MLQLLGCLLLLLDLGLEGFSKLDACKEESSSILCVIILLISFMLPFYIVSSGERLEEGLICENVLKF